MKPTTTLSCTQKLFTTGCDGIKICIEYLIIELTH
jgi:hypothetical protein